MAKSLIFSFLYKWKIYFFKTYDEWNVLMWRVTLGKPYHACGFLLSSELNCGKLPGLTLVYRHPRWLTQSRSHGMKGVGMCVGVGGGGVVGDELFIASVYSLSESWRTRKGSWKEVVWLSLQETAICPHFKNLFENLRPRFYRQSHERTMMPWVRPEAGQ